MYENDVERGGGISNRLKGCSTCLQSIDFSEYYTKRDIGWTIWCTCNKCNAETSGYCPDLSKEHRALDNIDDCKKLAIKAWNRRVEE